EVAQALAARAIFRLATRADTSRSVIAVSLGFTSRSSGVRSVRPMATTWSNSPARAVRSASLRLSSRDAAMTDARARVVFKSSDTAWSNASRWMAAAGLSWSAGPDRASADLGGADLGGADLAAA